MVTQGTTRMNPMKSQEQLSAPLVAALQACGRTMVVGKNTALFECGSAPLAVYQVQRGLIRLSSTSAAGKEAVLGVMGPGQWIGETSLFVNEPRLHDAWALQDSTLLVVPTADFRAVVDEQPAYLRELLQLLSHRYRAAMLWIDRSILMPFPVRLARRLLFEVAQAPQSLTPPAAGWRGMAAEGTRQSAQPVPVAAALQPAPSLTLSQQHLSDMLGVSRQSVNQQLKRWERQGLLSLSYGRVQVLDVTQLATLAEQTEPTEPTDLAEPTPPE